MNNNPTDNLDNMTVTSSEGEKKTEMDDIFDRIFSEAVSAAKAQSGEEDSEEEEEFRRPGPKTYYKGFRDVDAVTAYVTKIEGDFYAELKTIIRDRVYYNFLTDLGYGEQVEELLKKVKLTENATGIFVSSLDKEDLTVEEVEDFFDFLEANTKSEELKNALRKLYLEKGPHSYLIWWKEHMHFYKYHTGKARDYMDNVEKYEINETDISSMRASFLWLLDQSEGFRRMFNDNLFLVRRGFTGGRTQISSTHEEAYWHGELLGRPVPLGAMHSMSDKYLVQAFSEADRFSKNFAEDIGKTIQAIEDKDRIYLGFSVKDLILFIVLGVLVVICLARADHLTANIHNILQNNSSLRSLENYCYSLYNAFFVFIAFADVWMLFRLFKSRGTGAMIKKIRDASSAMEAKDAEEKEKFDLLKQRLLKESGKKFTIEDNGYEKQLKEINEKMDKMEAQSSLVKLVIHDTMVMFLTLVSFWYFGRYSVEAMGESFNFFSAACLVLTYLNLHMLLYYIEMILIDLIESLHAKIAVIILFVAYQIGMWVFLKGAGLFTTVRDVLLGESAGMGDGVGAKFLFFVTHITSRGGAVLIVTTIAGLLIILCTNAEDEADYSKNGLLAPGQGVSMVSYEPAKVKKGNKHLFILSTLFVLFDARVVAIMIHGISPIKIAIYTILGGVWVILYISFFTDELKAMYANRYRATFAAFYLYYIFLALAGVAGFSVKEVLFVTLQPLPMLLLFFALRMV